MWKTVCEIAPAASGAGKEHAMMCCMCRTAQRFADWGMERWRAFTVADVAAFKVCLLSVGALLGAYFARPLKKLRPLLWAVAVASYAWLIWRLVFDEK